MNQEANIQINIDYKNSYLHENEKGTWLVLVLFLTNFTDQTHVLSYKVLPNGELCEKIITSAPEVPKDGKSFPLSPKTVKATIISDMFILEPKGSRKDTIIVSKLNKEDEWHLMITENVSVLIDKSYFV